VAPNKYGSISGLLLLYELHQPSGGSAGSSGANSARRRSARLLFLRFSPYLLVETTWKRNGEELGDQRQNLGIALPAPSNATSSFRATAALTPRRFRVDAHAR